MPTNEKRSVDFLPVRSFVRSFVRSSSAAAAAAAYSSRLAVADQAARKLAFLPAESGARSSSESHSDGRERVG